MAILIAVTMRGQNILALTNFFISFNDLWPPST